MTGNQLRHVLRTYTSHWTFWWTVLVWTTTHVLFAWVSLENSILTQLTSLMLGTAIGQRMFLQFATPQARLMPRFAAAHFGVAGAMIATAVVIDGLLDLARGTSPWADACVSLAVLALGVWSCIGADRMSLTMILFFSMAFAVPHLPDGFVSTFVAGTGVSFFLAVACLGLMALVHSAVRLLRLTDETSGFLLAMYCAGSSPKLTSTTGRPWWQLVAQIDRRGRIHRWVADVGFRFVMRHLPAAGPLRQMVLRRLIGRSFGPLMGLALFALLFVCTWSGPPLDRMVDGFDVFPILCFPFVVATIGMVFMYLQRWPYLARESLLPCNRCDFVRGLARSGAYDMAIIALGHCAGLAVAWNLFHSKGPSLLPWLLVTMAQYAVQAGLILGLVSFHRALFPAVVLGITCFLLPGLATSALLAGNDFWKPSSLIPASLVTVAVAVGLYHLAVLLWREVEFD